MSVVNDNEIDWQAFRDELGEIAVTDSPRMVKQKSRDCFWYSPILKQKLNDRTADLLVRPRDRDELKRVLALAYAHRVPLTLRGGGTGNYGQAVPLDGGVIIDMTGLNQIREIGPDFVRAEAGCNLRSLNDALREKGRELPIFPSTQRIATVGGFVGGGSSGIGTVRHGTLRDPGNIIELMVLSVEAEPKEHVFRGDAINDIHHAWGMNGVIVEVTLPTVPREDWINCLASFADYETAFAAGKQLAGRKDICFKLVSTVDARIAAYFKKLQARLGEPRHLLISLVARDDLEGFRALAEAAGGRLDLAMDEAELQAAELPHVFEFSYNHTTLQVIKADPSWTYLQVMVPAPIDVAKVGALGRRFGDELYMHHEFARLGGELVAFDLPVLRFTSEARLYEIMDLYEAEGFPVSDPHTYVIEEGGMKQADYRHLAMKKRLDPLGLLNSGKSKTWARVKDLTADEIDALQGV
jgi:FAD/FMN-containing dehydrogenase